jgi:hypothetical protein
VPVGEEGGSGTTYVTPNIDSIGEMNVITSGYNAEHGRQSSGLVQITTKSGTNQLRGSAWTNLRRDEWNKNDFFREQAGQAKPFFEVNIGGYSIGGPVVIPKLIDSRTNDKKIFFFLSQEFTDDIRPTTVTRTNLPTALERNGDFSQTFFGKATLTDAGVTGASTLNVVRDPLTGVPFAGNVIPANRFHPVGRAMLLLAPLPNNVRDRTANAYHNSNDTQDLRPLHTRTNFVGRVDAVLGANTRLSGRALFDRDNAISPNSVAPGIGEINNVFPGDLVTGTMTRVMGPSMVNETIVGYSFNHWGHRVGTGKEDPSNYTQWWQPNVTNPLTGQVGFFVPRLEPFGPYDTNPRLKNDNKDEYPYLPQMDYRGGDRSGMLLMRPAGSSGPLPKWNQNLRLSLQNDLSWTKGRHNFKFGFQIERNSKTEPGSVDYTGQYNFGASADNPISSGNGYANALLGVFTSYTERNDRLDREARHWYSGFYAQDSWRLTSRLTLDYGLRVEHHGAIYESRGENSGFDPALWSASNAPTLFQPHCLTGVAGNLACSSANQRAINPLTGQVVSRAFSGTVVPGSGSITNGMWANGLANHPGALRDEGKKNGWYYDMPMFSYAPRVGLAWDVFGDGKTAIRASTGIFYNFVNQGQYGHHGGALITRVRTIQNAAIDDLQALNAAGSFAESPQDIRIAAGLPFTLHGQTMPQGELEPERNYHVNLAFQRDIGFGTVAEVAYVANIGRKFWRNKTINNIPINAYASPANLFNNEAIASNFIRRDFKGVGAISYLATDDDILNYNAMQVSVQRRLSRGFQMGMAYTLSKHEGMQGWDFMTEELGGKQGLRDRYYGPPAGNPTGVQDGRQDRRHVLVVNYSYMIPNAAANIPVLKYVLADWEASGVSTFMSGPNVNPTCNENLAGVQNDDPSLSGAPVRCELVPGEDPFDLSRNPVDPTVTHDAFRPHFNLNAFRRPLPVNGVGNTGNVPQGFLRHPGWQNWDFTLARRIPVNIGRGGSVRIQAQFYNVFNLVQFQRMAATYTFAASGNTNTTTGEYDDVINPLNFGITVRLDY